MQLGVEVLGVQIHLTLNTTNHRIPTWDQCSRKEHHSKCLNWEFDRMCEGSMKEKKKTKFSCYSLTKDEGKKKFYREKN